MDARGEPVEYHAGRPRVSPRVWEGDEIKILHRLLAVIAVLAIVGMACAQGNTTGLVKKDLVLSTYRLISACRGNVPVFLERCREAGLTRLRIFAVATWGGAQNMQPDNPDYWNRAETRIIQIAAAGLGVDLDLEDGQSIDNDVQRSRHWFLSDLGFDPTLWPAAKQEERKQYVSRWVGLLRKWGIDFRIAVVNEPLGSMIEFIRWHTKYLTDENGCNVPLERLIQSTSPTWTGNGNWQYAGILAPHGIWRGSQVGAVPAWAAVIIEDLGLSLLYSGDGLVPFPTGQQLAVLGVAIRCDPLAIGYEMKANEEVGAGSSYMDVDVMDYTRIQAISRTLNPDINVGPLIFLKPPLPETPAQSRDEKLKRRKDDLSKGIFGGPAAQKVARPEVLMVSREDVRPSPVARLQGDFPMNDKIAGLVVMVILLAIIGVLSFAVKMRREERRRRQEETIRRILKRRYGETDDE
jgi:hypothetical protein